MNNGLTFKQIVPTIFLKQIDQKPVQLIRITISSDVEVDDISIVAGNSEVTEEITVGTIPSGESTHEVFIDEITQSSDIEFVLMNDMIISDRKTVYCKPPKHWVVHVVQLSHHDPGYTDLPSKVAVDHDKWLDDALTYADETEDYPDDAKFRIVIEQNLSISHYIEHTSAGNVAKIMDLVGKGRFEITALFGNMITEICGHETLIRALYHAFRLKREYGFPIVSAEHNDITGFSWGLSTVLTEAGIKIFCPGLPLYYGWAKENYQSFWDEKAIFPHGGPGIFWWEAPSGKRVLLWCNNSGCGGGAYLSLPDLGEMLQGLSDKEDYPYSVMRYPVGGGSRDNSPYSAGYAHKIKKWNENWDYPHLVCSTNAKFYEDLSEQIPSDLPVFRGELAGQDYPVGSTSTAKTTAMNRNTHSNLITAEKFNAASDLVSDFIYQKDLIFKSYEEVLFHDEHAWGYHFPCGPASEASDCEKALCAYHAAAYSHEIINKAIARIADNIKLESEDFHLVVFNSTSLPKTDRVRAPMRELDNLGNEMYMVKPQDDPKGEGFLKGAILIDRWHELPTPDLIFGKFDLIDVSTDEIVPFQMIEIESNDETAPFAAQRLGLGSGSNRIGFFEIPDGLKRDLCFIASNVPAFGYKTYRLVPRADMQVFPETLIASGTTIENEYYRITADQKAGGIVSIYDKEANRELIDTECRHKFNSMIVREPQSSEEFTQEGFVVNLKLSGPVCKSIEISFSIHGHPSVKQTVSLYSGIKQIHFDSRILKDSTPLLDAHLAFPFKADKPVFRYEGCLSAMNPIADYLPGSYSDTIAVQNWVNVKDGNFNFLWSSLDAPIAGFSGLWPGYVSPAHRCLLSGWAKHPPLVTADLNKGWIYSNIFYNNFGTNFSVSQSGEVLFRYVITTYEGDLSDSRSAHFGWQAVTPLEQIFTKRPRNGDLPASDSFMQIDNDNVVVINFKKAENENGYILRVWNMSDETEKVKVSFNLMPIKSANLTNLAEEDMDINLEHDSRSVSFVAAKKSISTIRLLSDATVL